MQAARIAAPRGHEVRLWDKGRYLGGATPLANLVKGFEVDELDKFIAFFRRQVEKVGVTVELGREFEPSVLDRVKPDAVVLALGGTPVLPDVPGIDGKNVIKTSDLYGTLRLYLWLLGPTPAARADQVLDAGGQETWSSSAAPSRAVSSASSSRSAAGG